MVRLYSKLSDDNTNNDNDNDECVGQSNGSKNKIFFIRYSELG